MPGQVDRRQRLPALLAVFHRHVGADAAAHVPVGVDADEARRNGLDQVVDDGVGHLLVERAFVAKAPEVLLQALGLDAEAVGHDLDPEVREVGLAGQRAQAGELGHVEADHVVARRLRVREGLQLLAGARTGRHGGRQAGGGVLRGMAAGAWAQRRGRKGRDAIIRALVRSREGRIFH
jgi:hypothetical protein